MLLGPNKFHLLKIHHSEIAGVMQCMTEVEKVPKPRPEWLIFMFTNHCADWTGPQTSNQNILITPGRCKNLIWTGWDSRPTDDYIYVPSGIRYLRWRISANTQLRQVYTRAVRPSDLSLPSVRGSADHASPPSQPESFHSFIFINTKNCESDDDKSQHKGT